jgi:hypothetical protein
MYFLSIAMTLSMAANTPDPVNTARKAFYNCLIVEHNKAIDTKKTVTEFSKIVLQTCEVEKTSHSNQTIKSESSFGSTVTEAQQYANEEIKNITDGLVSSYTINSQSGSTLTPEK